MDERAVRRDLLRWYRRSARDLPWRRTRDPYAIWVSEVMLQQTRVDVVIPYFRRWMERFPTLRDLAAADLEDVMRAWSGLGYYSRARNLQAGARAVAAAGGRMPASADGLRALPGIGPYTAGAIASIAFGERVAAVDGNVVRVLARLHAWPGAVSSPALSTKVRGAAQRFVPQRSPGDWNQALMDLGATVCTPKAPACGECPVAAHCKARALGRQDSIPAPKRATAARVERRAFAVVRRAGKVLLVRNPSRGLLAGLWSLPGGLAERPLVDVVLEQAGAQVRPRGTPTSARHFFSHRTWLMQVDVADLVRDEVQAAQCEIAWVAERALADQALPTAMRTALAAAGVGRQKRRKESRPT